MRKSVRPSETKETKKEEIQDDETEEIETKTKQDFEKEVATFMEDLSARRGVLESWCKLFDRSEPSMHNFLTSSAPNQVLQSLFLQMGLPKEVFAENFNVAEPEKSTELYWFLQILKLILDQSMTPMSLIEVARSFHNFGVPSIFDSCCRWVITYKPIQSVLEEKTEKLNEINEKFEQQRQLRQKLLNSDEIDPEQTLDLVLQANFLLSNTKNIPEHLSKGKRK